MRFVTVNTFLTVFDEITWDIHGSKPFTSIEGMKDIVAPMYDQAYSALIEDLSRARHARQHAGLQPGRVRPHAAGQPGRRPRSLAAVLDACTSPAAACKAAASSAAATRSAACPPSGRSSRPKSSPRSTTAWASTSKPTLPGPQAGRSRWSILGSTRSRSCFELRSSECGVCECRSSRRLSIQTSLGECSVMNLRWCLLMRFVFACIVQWCCRRIAPKVSPFFPATSRSPVRMRGRALLVERIEDGTVRRRSGRVAGMERERSDGRQGRRRRAIVPLENGATDDHGEVRRQNRHREGPRRQVRRGQPGQLSQPRAVGAREGGLQQSARATARWPARTASSFRCAGTMPTPTISRSRGRRAGGGSCRRSGAEPAADQADRRDSAQRGRAVRRRLAGVPHARPMDRRGGAAAEGGRSAARHAWRCCPKSCCSSRA